MVMVSLSDSPGSMEFRKLREAHANGRTAGAVSIVSKWAMDLSKHIAKRKNAIPTLLEKASNAGAPIKAEIRGRFERVRQPGSILAVLPRVIEALVRALEHETPLVSSERPMTTANRTETGCSSTMGCKSSTCRDIVSQLEERRREAVAARDLEKRCREAAEIQVASLQEVSMTTECWTRVLPARFHKMVGINSG